MLGDVRTPRLSIVGAVLVVLGTLLGLVAAARPASAQVVTRPPGTTDVVEVVEVSGLLDPILVSFVEDRIEAANAEGIVALVLQLNSSGSVVSEERVVGLAQRMARSPVPVAVWVGPSKAQATGPAAQLVAIARPGGLAPGARIGRAGEQLLPREEFGVLFGDAANRLRDVFVRLDD
jgi:membrane-bound serine protease (ClpP class)